MPEIKFKIKPDEDNPDAAEILVEGYIDDHPYRFLLDTGAATSETQWDDFSSNFRSEEVKKSSGVFAPSERDLITYRIHHYPIR